MLGCLLVKINTFYVLAERHRLKTAGIDEPLSSWIIGPIVLSGLGAADDSLFAQKIGEAGGRSIGIFRELVAPIDEVLRNAVCFVDFRLYDAEHQAFIDVIARINMGDRVGFLRIKLLRNVDLIDGHRPTAQAHLRRHYDLTDERYGALSIVGVNVAGNKEDSSASRCRDLLNRPNIESVGRFAVFDGHLSAKFFEGRRPVNTKWNGEEVSWAGTVTDRAQSARARVPRINDRNVQTKAENLSLGTFGENIGFLGKSYVPAGRKANRAGAVGKSVRLKRSSGSGGRRKRGSRGRLSRRGWRPQRRRSSAYFLLQPLEHRIQRGGESIGIVVEENGGSLAGFGSGGDDQTGELVAVLIFRGHGEEGSEDVAAVGLEDVGDLRAITAMLADDVKDFSYCCLRRELTQEWAKHQVTTGGYVDCLDSVGGRAGRNRSAYKQNRGGYEQENGLSGGFHWYSRRRVYLQVDENSKKQRQARGGSCSIPIDWPTPLCFLQRCDSMEVSGWGCAKDVILKGIVSSDPSTSLRAGEW
jgi:hypothetical protein